jgi:hypothetical protein
MKSIHNLLWSLDLDFAAKVRHRMRYDKNPLHITVTDKYKVREYAGSKAVKTANLLFETDNPQTIPFSELPPNYLIKMNHGSGWNILSFDSELYLFRDGAELVNPDGSYVNTNSAKRYKLTQDRARSLSSEWLKSRYSKREWAYQHIVPRIIIEELLVAKDNRELKDYRLYTFHGEVKAILVDSPLYRRNRENVFFDPDWKEIKLTKYDEKVPHPLPEKPDSLEEMIDVAQKLGKDLDFARIDLYDTTQGVVQGEVTVYPDGGLPNTPTFCPVFNRWLGDQWQQNLNRLDATTTFFWYGLSVMGEIF